MSDQPRQNIEVKARYPDLNQAAEICARIGAEFQGILNQTDTYFSTRRLRTNLRQINDKPFEFITYARSNDPGSRSSMYTVHPLNEGGAKAILGVIRDPVLCVVAKHRELYLWHNVRIHLDAVDQLGSFIEFEGVVGPDADEQVSRQRVDRLVNEFAIAPSDQIGVSYSDLLMAK